MPARTASAPHHSIFLERRAELRSQQYRVCGFRWNIGKSSMFKKLSYMSLLTSNIIFACIYRHEALALTAWLKVISPPPSVSLFLKLQSRRSLAAFFLLHRKSTDGIESGPWVWILSLSLPVRSHYSKDSSCQLFRQLSQPRALL